MVDFHRAIHKAKNFCVVKTVNFSCDYRDFFGDDGEIFSGDGREIDAISSGLITTFYDTKCSIAPAVWSGDLILILNFLYFVFVFVVISYVDTFLHFFICDCFLLSENSLSFLVQYFGLTIDEFPLSLLLLFSCAWERSRAGNELQ